MSALEALHREPIGHGSHVLSLPAWLPPVRQKNALATYWHKPRSASLSADGTIYVRLWCGQARRIPAAELAATNDPPDELKCGTCVGRRLGYDRADGHVFTPRDHFSLPRRCPSTEPDPADLRLCLACGRPTSCARGWNSSGLAYHAPDPELAVRHTPCPWHGWSDIRLEWDSVRGRASGRLICGTFRCPHVSELS